jgi:phosphoglycolate phosphatase
MKVEMLAAEPGSTSLDLPKAVLFDLDGTLIDSVPDITLAVAELLASAGLAPVEQNAVGPMLGHGTTVLVQCAFAARGLDLDAVALDQMTRRMKDIYPRHLTGRTTLLPGAAECLAALAGAGCLLGLVTNKMQVAANVVLSHFGLSDYFTFVLGDQMRPQGLRSKPHADMLEFALARLGATPGEAVMVGDSAADIQAAAAAGVFSIAVRNGYSTVPVEELNPDAAIDDLMSMPAALDIWRAARRRPALRMEAQG